MTKEILKVENLSITFRFKDKRPTIYAVRGISFHINVGEVTALVGESGCGKSVTAYSIMRIEHLVGAQRDSGEIWFYPQNAEPISITSLSESECQNLRGNLISYIPQDPLMSLNPVLTIGEQITEVLQCHKRMSKSAAYQKAIELLDLVGLSDAKRRMQSYPHQLSGGLRQRVLTAIALACQPQLLIADEPTTALDVTIQAQVLDLLIKLQQKERMSVLFITHDLAIVSQICNRIIVMYAGQIMEEALVEEIFNNAQHPYTIGLLKGRPTIDKKQDQLYSIPGQPPDLYEKIEGCPFAPRCEYRTEKCSQPLITKSLTETHKVACHLFD